MDFLLSATTVPPDTLARGASILADCSNLNALVSMRSGISIKLCQMSPSVIAPVMCRNSSNELPIKFRIALSFGILDLFTRCW